jgi:hypothetical protein
MLANQQRLKIEVAREEENNYRCRYCNPVLCALGIISIALILKSTTTFLIIRFA